MEGLLSRIASWQFLGEPLTRWALFIGAMLALIAAWQTVLKEMR